MSRVLVIPDVHNKTAIWDYATTLLREESTLDYAVVLGDTIDDFYNVDQDYRINMAKMVVFNYEFPNTVWLLGNHEISYLIDRPVTGNITSGKRWAERYVDNFKPMIVWEDGSVVFSHAGVWNQYCEYSPTKINSMDYQELWRDDSPIWARPQLDNGTVTYTAEGEYSDKLQVIGHTPTPTIQFVSTPKQRYLSCDVFSTNWGKKLGEEHLVIVDTTTAKYQVDQRNYRQEFTFPLN